MITGTRKRGPSGANQKEDGVKPCITSGEKQGGAAGERLEFGCRRSRKKRGVEAQLMSVVEDYNQMV